MSRGFGNDDGSTFRGDDGADGFGRGSSSTFPSANEPFDQRAPNAPLPGAGGGVTPGSDQQERDPFDDPLFQGRDFGGGMPGNYWHGPGAGVGATAPGEYGFMQQYSNMRSAPASNAGGTTNRSGVDTGSGSRRGSPQNNGERPNYFNGSYSRSRL
jgi:hypothetical protein